MEPYTGMYANAGSLFRTAIEGCESISSPPSGVPHRRAALSSIIFATISAEAFINEIHHMARPLSEYPSGPGALKALTDLLAEAEESHASIESKYQLATFILSGRPFDRGAPPFQNFALLIDVRNLIVHSRPVKAILRQNT